MAETETLNLIQKLAKIRAISDVVAKEKRGYNYSYADITSILAKITAGMKKYGVSLIPQIVPGTSHVEQLVTSNTKFTKTGEAYEAKTSEMLVTADMVFKWVDDANPEDFIEVPWFVTGSQGDPSQALGSGLTYCTTGSRLLTLSESINQIITRCVENGMNQREITSEILCDPEVDDAQLDDFLHEFAIKEG